MRTKKLNYVVVAILAIALGSTLSSYKTKSSVEPVGDTTPWKAPTSAKALKNPHADKKSSAKKGKSIFKTYCVVCHGASGLGDGVGGKALDPKPANFHSSRVQNQVDGELFWKMSNGRNAMIAWKGVISEEDRWHLVNFLRTFKE